MLRKSMELISFISTGPTYTATTRKMPKSFFSHHLHLNNPYIYMLKKKIEISFKFEDKNI
jgi:hypothetical protein